MIGPHGAGKTTLFRMITGQETSDAGDIRVGRKDTAWISSHNLVVVSIVNNSGDLGSLGYTQTLQRCDFVILIEKHIQPQLVTA